jgi:hypothetical protein
MVLGVCRRLLAQPQDAEENASGRDSPAVA